MQLSRLSILPLLLATAACSSGPKRLAATDNSLLGFPPLTAQDIVYAQARFEDPQLTFGVDLLEENGILPIILTVQLRGQGQENAQILISPERMDLRLYLADGTPVRPVSAEAVAAVVDEQPAARVQERKFRGGLLSSSPTEGFVFFQLGADEFDDSRGATVLHAVEAGFRRALDVGHSLLAFNVTIQNTQQPFFVGIER